MAKKELQSFGDNHQLLFIAFLVSLLLILFGCGGPSAEELAVVNYTPQVRDDWEVSTPEVEGLDPTLVAEAYYNASQLETIYSFLIIKNSRLVAEKYFDIGKIWQKALVQSAAKSVTSALVGIALDQGCLSSVDQKMFEFFPEYADQITDSRKSEITIRDMLQMQTGYPPEESDDDHWEAVLSGDYVNLVVGFPITSDPGTEFQYSNLTTHWLGVIVARACNTDLETLGQEYLFGPLGGEVGAWKKDLDGYNWAAGELHLTARDAAKFGLLYLNEGEYEGNQLVSADWVRDSLKTNSEDAYDNIGRFHDVGYGYQWWSAEVEEYHINFAWGHGGQLIVLVDELDMVVVVTADPFYEVYGSESWTHEKANISLVGDFISFLADE